MPSIINEKFITGELRKKSGRYQKATIFLECVVKMSTQDFHTFLKILMQSKQYDHAKLFVEDLKGNESFNYNLFLILIKIVNLYVHISKQ